MKEIIATGKTVDLAIEEANLVLFVVDIQSGITPLDQEVAERLRRAGKKVFLICNKADNAALDHHSHEFDGMGFSQTFNVSAIHDRGIEALIKAAIRELPKTEKKNHAKTRGFDLDGEEEPELEKVEGPLKIAFVGRPNVGKSSIVNKITSSNRVIVSPIPGTTRDSVDIPFSVETEGVRQEYILVDTAGVRKERKIHDSIEFYSIKRTEDSIERCDIAVLMLDASEGILEQDKKIADKIAADITNAIFPAKIVGCTFPLITINRGKGTGIKSGQTWVVYAIGEEMIDPDTGESLGTEEIPICKAKVLTVKTKTTTLQIVGDDMGVEKGMIVRPEQGNEFGKE